MNLRSAEYLLPPVSMQSMVPFLNISNDKICDNCLGLVNGRQKHRLSKRSLRTVPITRIPRVDSKIFCKLLFSGKHEEISEIQLSSFLYSIFVFINPCHFKRNGIFGICVLKFCSKEGFAKNFSTKISKSVVVICLCFPHLLH